MSPNTFNIKTRTAPAQAQNQYRPEDLLAKAPQGSEEFAGYLNQVHRQVFDKVQELRNNWTPRNLYVAGESTALDVLVPVQISATDSGTSFIGSLTFNREGKWLVTTSVNLKIIGDTDIFTVTLLMNGVAVNPYISFQSGADIIVPLHQQWMLNSLSGNENLALRIKKAAGGGTSVVVASNTTFSASWQGTGA